MHTLQELVRLHRQGKSAREAALLLKVSRNTVRVYLATLRRAGLLDGPEGALPSLETLKAAVPRGKPPQERSTVAGWEPRIKQLSATGAGPRAIFDLLRTTEADFKGSLSAVKRSCVQLKRRLGPCADDVAIPVVTEPGQVAQVDFKYAGLVHDAERNCLRKAWIFIMVLGHSRHMFARVAFDQRAETWQRLHMDAFAHFGGVPRVIVPDNLKAAVVQASFVAGEDPQLHRGYRELARHYGFTIDPAPPRDPEKKGKVEAGCKYVGNNFLATLPEGLDLEVVNERLGRWVMEVAGRRVHGRTHRQPLMVFEGEERASLLPLPARPYLVTVWKEAKVHRDSHVAFDKRLYSVPFRHLGAVASVRATPTTVQVYVDDVLVARHDREAKGQYSTLDEHLPAERVALRHRDEAFWTSRAAHLGPEVEALVAEVLALAGPVNPVRRVMGIIGLLEKHPRERADNAARRARHFGMRTCGELGEMLRKGLDFQPLPPDLPLPDLPPNPRFARDLGSLLTDSPGKKDDWN
ncbi:MAG: IS21 family transposase [Candidatus Deferrimicrobiota bacterium]